IALGQLQDPRREFVFAANTGSAGQLPPPTSDPSTAEGGGPTQPGGRAARWSAAWCRVVGVVGRRPGLRVVPGVGRGHRSGRVQLRQEGVADGGELVDLLVGEGVGYVVPNRGDVTRGSLADLLPARLGDSGVGGPAVLRAGKA